MYTLGIKEPNNCVSLTDGKLALVRNIGSTEDFFVKVVVPIFGSIRAFMTIQCPQQTLAFALCPN